MGSDKKMSVGSMQGRTCLVTGANSGIGKATSTQLARMGASVVMVCRDKAKGQYAIDEIRKETGNQSLELMIADLSSLDSVRELASEYSRNHDKLQVLINNAGLIIGEHKITKDGLETTFVVNYLSHFLLTMKLLDILKASAPSRIVNVSSSAHVGGHIDFENLQGEKRYSAMGAYSQSKLAQVLFTHVMAEMLNGTGVTVNSVHPGVVRTRWGDEAGMLGIGIRLARPFMISPEKGAETSVYVATSPDAENITGKYFSNKKETDSSKESYDKIEASRLWDVSMRLAGLAGKP